MTVLLQARLLSQHRTTLIKAGIILAVLFLAAYLGRRATTLQLTQLAALAGGLVLLRRPHWGLIALVPAALSVPFEIGTGTQTTLSAGMLLLAALLGVWIVDMLGRRQLRLAPSPVNLPAIAFMVSATLSFLAGSQPWNLFANTASLAAQAGGYAVFVLSAGALLLVGNLTREVRWLKWMVGLFLLIGGLYVAGQLLPPLGALTGRLLVRGANGSLFWVWLVALAGGLAVFHRRLHPALRLGLAALALATVALGYGWKSGWLPPLVVLWVLLWLRSWRLGLALTAIGALALLAAGRDPVSLLVTSDRYSVDTRLLAWDIVLNRVLPHNPVLGLGPANYYHYTPLYPILGYAVKFNSHNQYVDILAQTGVLGMATFLWLMGALGRLGWRLRNQAEMGFWQAYVCAGLAGLAGMLVAGMLGDWVLPFVYNITLAGFRASMLGWLFLGGLLAIQHRGSAKDTKVI